MEPCYKSVSFVCVEVYVGMLIVIVGSVLKFKLLG